MVVAPVRPISTVLNEAILPDVIDSPDSVSTHFCVKLSATLYEQCYTNLAFPFLYYVFMLP